VRDGWGCVGLSAVVGFAAFDGVDPVDLFEEDDESEFVLEGERAEGPDFLGGGAEGWAVAVCAADEEGDAFGAGHFPAVDADAEGVGGEGAAAFVHGDAETAVGGAEETFFDFFAGAVADVFDFELAHAGEAGGVIGDAVAGPWESGAADGEDFPVHGVRWRDWGEGASMKMGLGERMFA